jgi:hypothetical protein
VDVNDDIEYVAGTTAVAIIEDLIKKGYIYGPGDQVSYIRSIYSNGTFSHLVVWDSSAPPFEMGMSFDIRVSIDLAPYAPDRQIMKSFQCTMNGTGVEWVLANINSTDVLLTFVPDLQGNIYNGQGTAASNDSGRRVEQYLNTLVMVAGGSGYVINSPAVTGDGAGNTQGCLVPRTTLPWEIVFLFVIVSAFAVTFVVNFICGKIGGSLYGVEGYYLNRIKHETPNSLLDWMAQSVRECVFRDETFKEEDLTLWGFSPRDDDMGLGVQRLENP